jgi:uncharacterized protein
MEFIKNIHLKSQRYKKEFLADIIFEKNNKKKPVVVFSHGFKSFKDWGTFNLLAEYFAVKGLIFIKFNFPFSGTTLDNPMQITDIDSFRKNNYKIELDNLKEMVDWVVSQKTIPEEEIDKSEIYLMGHSRGGDISILEAATDPRVKKVVSWSAFADMDEIMNECEPEKWEKDGVRFTPDRLTGQPLPMDYSIYSEYLKYKDLLNIRQAVTNIKIPLMVVHGTEDETIAFEDGLKMKEWNTKIELSILPLVNHIYGGHHPYEQIKLPYDTRVAANESIEFMLGK